MIYEAYFVWLFGQHQEDVLTTISAFISQDLHFSSRREGNVTNKTSAIEVKLIIPR